MVVILTTNPFITLCAVLKTIVGNQMQKETNKHQT